jgi:hypothetical protein
MGTLGFGRQSRRRCRSGAPDVAAIHHLLCSENLAHQRTSSIDLGVLARYERPMPVMVDYDRLLQQEIAG